MTNFLKGTTLSSRRTYYLLLAAAWSYSFGPPLAGFVFLALTGRVPLLIQLLNAAWFILIIFFTPSLSELFHSYGKYVEEWRANNEQQEDGAQTEVPRPH
jgi:hypothetical protein